MKIDSLDGLNDAELQAIIARSQELLKVRDEGRKAKALRDAKALLASVGLNLKSLSHGKGKAAAKMPPYKAGVLYQHPSDPSLVWNAKGQKPKWLRELETESKQPIEVPAETAAR